ncbi:MAG TPA: 50S ribosomal protein L25 [Bryobacteraceae bacterium]|nr:50S ribosomal protein L25 [Bryobacteraceae bacterium]
MRKDITITAEPRELRGKNEARRLRARGMSPAVVYGPGSDPVAVAVDPKQVNSILKSTSGHNTIFNVDIQGQSAPVMIVDWQHDPIKSRLLHIDMKRIDLSKRIVVKIPVHTHGDPRGVKLQGGQYEIITREIEIECLPEDIPELFSIDVTTLEVGKSIRANDVPLGGSMKLVSSGETVISHVVPPKGAEATADDGAAAPEPEVIKKGKKEDEEKKDDKKKK